MRLTRGALVVVGVAQAYTGVWGLLAPKSFFDDFPGAGHHWVAALGTYNQHLVRDYAAAELGLAVLLLAAAIWFTPHVVLIAGGSFLAATVPHFLYHLTTTGSFTSVDNEASLGSFGVEIVLVALAMFTVTYGERSPHVTTARS